MTTDDRKRLIQRELTALERLGSETNVDERLARLLRLGDLYHDIDQYQQAGDKYHDYRTLAVGRGLLGRAGAIAMRLKEAWCLYERGDLPRTERFLEETECEIAGLDEESRLPLFGELSILYGYLEVKKGRYDGALRRCEDAFRILQRSGDDAVLAKLQICFGHVYFRTGAYARAREYYEDALASARRATDSRRLVQATINLALVCKEQSDHDRALYLLDQAKEILDVSGDFSYRGHVLLNMAVIHFHKGSLQLAEEAYRDSLRIYLQAGQQQCVALARIGLARILILRGRSKEAGSLLESTLPICVEQGYLREEVLIRRDLGDVERALGRPDAALRCYKEALGAAKPLGRESEHVVQIGRRLGVTMLRLGKIDEGGSLLRKALITARKIDERYEEAILCSALGQFASIEGRSDEVERMFHLAIDQLRSMGEKIELGKALVRHVRLGIERGQGEEGDWQLEIAEARRIFREADVPLWLGKARLEEARLFAREGGSGKWEFALAEADRIFTETGDARFLGRVDELRHSLEEKIIDRSLSGRNDHLAINDLLPSLSDDFDLKHMLEDLVRRTQGERGILVVFGGAEKKPAARAVYGMNLEKARRVVGTLRPVFERCRAGGRPFLSTAVSKDTRVAGATLPEGGVVRSLLVVPFRTNMEISGAIYLDRGDEKPPYGSRQLDLVVGLVRSQRFVLTLLSTRQKELEAENVRLREQVSRSSGFDKIVTQSGRMDEVLNLVRKVACSNVTVLVRGETGTGKQLIANAIHVASPRAKKTLYSVNCATLPEQLLESELFGHAHGSFTGAHADKVGLLVVATGSTVFLDEIDKMNPRVQSKLLHVLDEKRIRPLGSNEYRDVEVRFVCATNRDLTVEVQEGRFLEDLYYRLNVISIDLPPLRERMEDILLLSNYFLRVFSAEIGKEPVRLDETAAQVLVRHRWPGNVRELRSEMRRLVVLDETGVVTADKLSPAVREAVGSAGFAPMPAVQGEGPLKTQVEKYERELLRMHLEKHNGNVSKTARALGLSRWGLHKKLEKYGFR